MREIVPDSFFLAISFSSASGFVTILDNGLKLANTTPGNALGVYEEHRPSSVQPKEVTFNRGKTSPNQEWMQKVKNIKDLVFVPDW